ncbi:MAG TPA: hypothetical protein VNX18_06070 [Bryobacteraceae bacterium]|nr:hypothetical protein [Bryobacteraceae bacterium]
MPIQGVHVQGLEMGWKLTDSDGRYVLQLRPINAKMRPRAVWFHAEGFQPVARLTRPGVDVVNARLEPNGKTLWHIPPCDASRPLATGRRLAVRLPTDAKDGGVVSATDVSARHVNFEFRGRIFHAEITFIGLVDAWPGEVRYAESRTFSQRTWVSDAALTGFDARGVFKNGTLWRSIGLYVGGESVEYMGVPPEVATVFDRVLDSVCVVAAR